MAALRIHQQALIHGEQTAVDAQVAIGEQAHPPQGGRLGGHHARHARECGHLLRRAGQRIKQPGTHP